MRSQRLLTVFALTAAAIFGQSKQDYHPFHDIQDAFTPDSPFHVSPSSIVRDRYEASDALPTNTSLSGKVQGGPRQDDAFELHCVGTDCDFTLTSHQTLTRTVFQRFGETIIITTSPEINAISLDDLKRGPQKYVQIVGPDNKLEARTCTLKEQDVFDPSQRTADNKPKTITILDYDKCGPLKSELVPADKAWDIANTLVDIAKDGSIGAPVTTNYKTEDLLSAAKDYLSRQKDNFSDIIKKVVTKNPLPPPDTVATLGPADPRSSTSRPATTTLAVAAKQ